MHTATNYYLFSLAISDLLLLTSGLPPEIYKIWCRYPYIFGEVFCVLQAGYDAQIKSYWIICFDELIEHNITERDSDGNIYVAICHPFLSHTLSKLSRAIRHIVAIWVMALCLAVPQAMSFGVVCEVIAGEMHTDHCLCVPKRTVLPHAFEISTFVFFVAPMSMITVLYILIGVSINYNYSQN
ncbi:unnamed protein product [Acanthoscelides obtectus]|uniref:G-protein coupled receptors family 1 profile domain-containing protein n=1 Tax=Acanthoscelides obtectus TaxID=200917 RepID=A0A9P0M7S3_ACAOB|nr:unnamed protein product [Acanthoscelides obtectus]CAK1665509.1 Pyrokinin-1 receptor [Acanthoscelides obtectus]